MVSVSSLALILETCGFSASANASLSDPELQQGSVSSEKAAARGEQIKALTVHIKANIHPDSRRQPTVRLLIQGATACLADGRRPPEEVYANRNPS